MLSSLTHGYGSWTGDYLLDKDCDTEGDDFFLPVLPSAEPLHRHGITVSPRVKTSSTLPGTKTDKPDGQMSLPKTFLTKKGALLLFSAQEKLLHEVKKKAKHGSNITVAELSLKLRTLERLTLSVLEFGDENYDHDEASITDPESQMFLHFLRSLNKKDFDLKSQPGGEYDHYLRDLTSRTSHHLPFGMDYFIETDGKDTSISKDGRESKGTRVSDKSSRRILSSERLTANLRSGKYLGRPWSAGSPNITPRPVLSASYSWHTKSAWGPPGSEERDESKRKLPRRRPKTTSGRRKSKTAQEVQSSESGREPVPDVLNKENVLVDESGDRMKEDSKKSRVMHDGIEEEGSIASSVLEEQELPYLSASDVENEEELITPPASTKSWPNVEPHTPTPQEVVVNKDEEVCDKTDYSQDDDDGPRAGGDQDESWQQSHPLVPQYSGLMTGVRSFSLVDTQAVLPVQEDEPISSEKDNTSHHETDEKDEREILRSEENESHQSNLETDLEHKSEIGDINQGSSRASSGAPRVLTPSISQVSDRVLSGSTQTKSSADAADKDVDILDKSLAAENLLLESQDGEDLQTEGEQISGKISSNLNLATSQSDPSANTNDALKLQEVRKVSSVSESNEDIEKTQPVSVDVHVVMTSKKPPAKSQILSKGPSIPVQAAGSSGQLKYTTALDITAVQTEVIELEQDDSIIEIRYEPTPPPKPSVSPRRTPSVLSRRTPTKQPDDELKKEWKEMNDIMRDSLSGLGQETDVGMSAEELLLAQAALQEKLQAAETRMSQVGKKEEPQKRNQKATKKEKKTKKQATPVRKDADNEREAIREQRRLDVLKKMEEAQELKEKISKKEAERLEQELSARRAQQELHEQMALLAEEEEEMRLAEEEARQGLIDLRKMQREDREAHRKNELERKKQQAIERREREKKMMEKSRQKELEMLDRIADGEMRRRLAEEEQRKADEEERLAQERLEEEIQQAKMLDEEEEQRLLELERQAEEEAMRRLEDEREEAERKHEELERESWRLKELEDAKRLAMLEEQQSLEAEQQKRQEEEARVQEEARQRMLEFQRLEEEAREQMRRDFEKRQESALRRREKNMEGHKNLRSIQHGQSFTKPWVFSYCQHWPKETYNKKMGTDSKKKNFGAPKKPKSASANSQEASATAISVAPV